MKELLEKIEAAANKWQSVGTGTFRSTNNDGLQLHEFLNKEIEGFSFAYFNSSNYGLQKEMEVVRFTNRKKIRTKFDIEISFFDGEKGCDTVQKITVNV